MCVVRSLLVEHTELHRRAASSRDWNCPRLPPWTKNEFGSWPSGRSTRRMERPCARRRGASSSEASLATAVGVCIEGEINRAWAVAQLLQLAGIQMCAQRASDVAKARLPQHGIVEQPLDENDLRALLNLFPGIQATLRAVKESMGEGGSDTAAVEIDDTPALATREDHAPIEGIAPLWIEQAETL